MTPVDLLLIDSENVRIYYHKDTNAFDGLNQETISLLYSMVDEFKNVRSHVAAFEFESASYGTVYMPAGIVYNNEIEIRQQFCKINELPGKIFIGCAVYIDSDVVCNEFILNR